MEHAPCPASLEPPSTAASIAWDFPAPYTMAITVGEEDIDALQHANNTAYVRWIEQVSWAHSESRGLGMPEYRRLGRAMIIRRHELDYLAPAFLGDRLQAATWIEACDGRYTLKRRFQVVRPRDGISLLRGLTTFVCIDLATARLKRMPREFTEAYLPIGTPNSEPAPAAAASANNLR